MASATDASLSALEARLEARLESVLEDIGQAYNTVEDRVHALESASPSDTTRMSKLEEVIRPYEKHDKKIQDVVNELNALKKKHEAFKTGSLKEWARKFQIFADGVTKRSDEIAKKVNDIRPVDLTTIEEQIQRLTAETAKISKDSPKNIEELTSSLMKKTDVLAKRIEDIPAIHNQEKINASVQTLLVRVSKLEGRPELPTQQEPLSTSAMADALISRLAQGDSIDNVTVARLREVLPTTASFNSDQQTTTRSNAATYPTPNSAHSISKQALVEKPSASTQRKRTIEQLHADNHSSKTALRDESPPRKRARAKAQPARSTARKSLVSAPTPQVDEALAKNSAVHGAEKDAVTTTNIVPEEETEETPEIRRSSRTPKPNRKHASFLTWIEVRDRRKTR